MSLSKVSKWFGRFGEFQIKHRAIFIVSICIITIIGCLGLTRLNISDDMDSWFDDSDDIMINQDRFEEIFGNEDKIMILVQAPDVFDPVVLENIKSIGERLITEVPFAKDITSLTELSVSMGNEEGFEIINPFEDVNFSSITEGQLQEKKNFILSREALVNTLVSDDATETWVMVSLYPYEDDFNDMYKVGEAAIPIVESDDYKGKGFTLKATGMAYTETEEHAVIMKEASLRIISGFFVMILCLVIFIRSFRGIIVPLFAIVGGIGTVFGFMGWFNISADSSLVTLPILQIGRAHV